MNKIIHSVFDRDYLMNQSLKYVDHNRQKLRNDHPWKYWLINQDLYINITVLLWLVWQAWALSALFTPPTKITSVGPVDFYLSTSFYKIGNLRDVLAQNRDVVIVLFQIQSYIFVAYTILITLFSVYTIIVVHHYVKEIKLAVKINKVSVWKWKINLFYACVYGLIFYGAINVAWIILGLFYVPDAKASVGFSTLVYHIGAKNSVTNQVFQFSHPGLILVISVSVNLGLLTLISGYYWKQRFVGYKYFFAFEKKLWKKIDYVGEKMGFQEKYQLRQQNQPHRGSQYAQNNDDYIIEIKNVNKFFLTSELKFQALKDINLKIKKGEFVVILGPSGSGKTTLLNIISGVDRPTNGEIVVANYNIINMRSTQLTKYRKLKTGYIFQQYSLLPNLNVRENIAIGYHLGQTQFRQLQRINTMLAFKQAQTAQKKARVFLSYLAKLFKSRSEKNKLINEMISLLGLSEHAHKYPSQLSGGQQQRVAIARAFVKRPEILFGDEPTGAIDVNMSKQILELFYLINKFAKTTVLLVTHNPIIAEMATRVIEVHNGVITKNAINEHPKLVDQLKWH